MRVLCINVAPIHPLKMPELLTLLKEGETYTVSDVRYDGNYNLVEAPHPYYPRGSWNKLRFIPCSEQDENELVTQRENTLTV